jgi:peptide/nickel transport system permease protein
VKAYIARRLIQAVFVIFIVTLVVFFAIRLLPGDPIYVYISSDMVSSISPERIALIRHELGLDQPMIVQYANWMSGLFHGDLGESIFYREPVSKLIGIRLPITLHLGLIAFVFASILGILGGTLSALRRGKILDLVVTILANIGICIPVFWLGVLLMYFLAFQLGWLPIGGYTSPFKDFLLSTQQIIVPVMCLMTFTLAADARQSRSSILEVTHQDYVRTAWSKGLRERLIVQRHILKNAFIPIVAFKGMGFAYIIGGSVLVEQVFNINGIGRLAANAVLSQDYAVIQGVILMTAVMVTIVNIIVDISYAWLDPRIRYS